MRLTREQYEAALEEMRTVAGGQLQETDYLTSTLGPYRLGLVRVRADHDDAAGITHDLARLAVDLRGSLWLHVSERGATVEVTVTRDLSEGEADGLIVCRDVGGES